MVEQGTENPRVGSSILSLGTTEFQGHSVVALFSFNRFRAGRAVVPAAMTHRRGRACDSERTSFSTARCSVLPENICRGRIAAESDTGLPSSLPGGAVASEGDSASWKPGADTARTCPIPRGKSAKATKTLRLCVLLQAGWRLSCSGNAVFSKSCADSAGRCSAAAQSGMEPGGFAAPVDDFWLFPGDDLPQGAAFCGCRKTVLPPFPWP